MSNEEQNNIDDVESNIDEVSNYDDVDVDVDDVDDVDVDIADDQETEEIPSKHDPEDDDDNDPDADDGYDEDDDPDVDRVMRRKKHHVYHQIPESTEIVIVDPSNRITSEYMTLYEYSIVVGTRATHIANGSVLYTDPEGLFDPRDIAKKEINENKCPLSVTRKISPTKIEVWEVNEMIKPQM